MNKLLLLGVLVAVIAVAQSVNADSTTRQKKAYCKSFKASGRCNNEDLNICAWNESCKLKKGHSKRGRDNRILVGVDEECNFNEQFGECEGNNCVLNDSEDGCIRED